jgi:hypothetical protein
VKTFPRFDQRREDFDPTFARDRFGLRRNRRETLLFDREIALGTKLRAELRKQQPQEMVDLRDRCSIATEGGNPVIRSTSGFSSCSTN